MGLGGLSTGAGASPERPWDTCRALLFAGASCIRTPPHTLGRGRTVLGFRSGNRGTEWFKTQRAPSSQDAWAAGHLSAGRRVLEGSVSSTKWPEEGTRALRGCVPRPPHPSRNPHRLRDQVAGCSVGSRGPQGGAGSSRGLLQGLEPHWPPAVRAAPLASGDQAATLGQRPPGTGVLRVIFPTAAPSGSQFSAHSCSSLSPPPTTTPQSPPQPRWTPQTSSLASGAAHYEPQAGACLLRCALSDTFPPSAGPWLPPRRPRRGGSFRRPVSSPPFCLSGQCPVSAGQSQGPLVW